MRSALVCALGLILAAMTPRAASGQTSAERPTFRSAVDLVSVTVVVKDRHGRFVRDLTADDFVVLDGGERRPIVDFTAGSSADVTLAMLVDESGSMGIGPGVDQARRSVDGFLSVVAESGRGRDEVALFGFDARVRELQPFTREIDQVRAALARVEPYGATSIYDAVAETARRVAERGRVRRALVVVTDGLDNESRLSLESASGLASAIDVPVYVVEVGRSPVEARREADRRAVPSGTATLEDLARWTGGEHLRVGSDPLALRLAAARIVADVRYQYLLAIESAPQPGWRALQVSTRDKHHTVRARGAYMAGAQRPADGGPPPWERTRNEHRKP
jgi:Ca-activated chloride channel homolog